MWLCASLGAAPSWAAVSGQPVTIPPSAVVSWQALVARAGTLAGATPAQLPKPPKPRGPRPFGVRATKQVPSVAGSASVGVADTNPPLRATCPPSAGPLAPAGFQGAPDTNARIPPDTMGAVGPDHVVTMLNTLVRVHARTGDVLSSLSLFQFWQPLLGNPFDPKLIYDHHAGRWVGVCTANPRLGTSAIYLAVSATADPLGTWTYYLIDADATNLAWADFPGVGLNQTWIAIAANMFTNLGDEFVGVKLWVIDKASLVDGQPLGLTVFEPGFDVVGDVRGQSVQPCVTYDGGPNAASSLYLVDQSGAFDTQDGTPLLQVARITGASAFPVWSPAPGSAYGDTGLFKVGAAFEFEQEDAPQRDDERRIETNETYIQNAVFRNGRIWTAHTGKPPGAADQTAVYWYQIDPAALPAPIVQSGVLSGLPGEHLYFPTIAANCADDAVLGFTRSDASTYADAAYCVRLGTDPPGTLRPAATFKVGEASYYKTFGGGFNRWGDYSATCVDPLDDRAIWTIQEYAAPRFGPANADSRWGTWWARLGFPSCADAPLPGDLNCDNAVTFADIDPFVAALGHPGGVGWPNPDCPWLRGDVNEDGAVTFADINPFVGVLGTHCP